jgi:hypothetical protein
LKENGNEKEPKMADNNLKLKSNDSIANFVLAADLEQFQAAFQSQGVIKVEHIIDVAKEDLIKIGEYKIIHNLIFIDLYSNSYISTISVAR